MEGQFLPPTQHYNVCMIQLETPKSVVFTQLSLCRLLCELSVPMLFFFNIYLNEKLVHLMILQYCYWVEIHQVMHFFLLLVLLDVQFYCARQQYHSSYLSKLFQNHLLRPPHQLHRQVKLLFINSQNLMFPPLLLLLLFHKEITMSYFYFKQSLKLFFW